MHQARCGADRENHPMECSVLRMLLGRVLALDAVVVFLRMTPLGYHVGGSSLDLVIHACKVLSRNAMNSSCTPEKNIMPTTTVASQARRCRTACGARVRSTVGESQRREQRAKRCLRHAKAGPRSW